MKNTFYEVKSEEYYEEPPILNVSINELNLEIAAFSVYTGAFKINNVGKGNLKGRIFSKNGYASFNPPKWESNEQVIIYRIDTKELIRDYHYKDIWLIETNGGEKEILVDISITYPLLIIDDKNSISDLKEFASYAKSNWSNAKEIFFSPLFISWINNNKNIGFINIYNQITTIKDKDWALEYFLRLAGLKHTPSLWIQENERIIDMSPINNKALLKSLVIRKRGWGLLEGEISSDVSWIRLKKTSFNLMDFDNNKLIVDYEVLADRITNKISLGKIYVKYENKEIVYNIKLIRKKALTVTFSKKSFKQDDVGVLIVDNYTGEDLMLEVNPKDPWILFEAKKYLIAKHAEIPFRIHMTRWHKIGMGKVPYYDSLIEIQANSKRRIFRQKLIKKIDVVN